MWETSNMLCRTGCWPRRAWKYLRSSCAHARHRQARAAPISSWTPNQLPQRHPRCVAATTTTTFPSLATKTAYPSHHHVRRTHIITPTLCIYHLPIVTTASLSPDINSLANTTITKVPAVRAVTAKAVESLPHGLSGLGPDDYRPGFGAGSALLDTYLQYIGENLGT